MKQLNANRLTHLYNIMNDFPEDHNFGMSHWMSMPPCKTEEIAVECGTSCCAAGWGVLMIPSWNKHLRVNNTKIFYYSKNVIKHNEFFRDDYGFTIKTLSHFLDISEEQSESIFQPSEYKSFDGFDDTIKPRQVATRIKQVLNKQGYELI